VQRFLRPEIRSKWNVVAFQTVSDGTFAKVIFLTGGRGRTLWLRTLLGSWALVTSAATPSASITTTPAATAHGTALLLLWRRAVAFTIVAAARVATTA
jgi:hypothetical protein